MVAVADAGEYPWSSYNARVSDTGAVRPDHDPCYLALGNSGEERRLRYREYVQRTT